MFASIGRWRTSAGWHRDQLIGKRDEDVFPSAEASFFRRKDREALASGARVDIAEERLITRTGDVRYLHTKKVPVPDGNGQPRYLLGIAEDITEIKLAQERARAGEARIQAMLDSALDAIIMIDHEGKVVEWNPAAEVMFGYGRQQALGQRLPELIIPETSRELHEQGLEFYRQTGETKLLGRRKEMTARRADGSTFPVELTVVRIGLPGPPSFTGFVRDLSERRRAEEALRISEERLGLLAENSLDMVYRYRLRPTRGAEYLSPAVARMIGYSLEELYAADWDFALQHIHPADRAILEAMVERGPSGPIELRWVRKDGTVVSVEHRDVPIRDAQGQMIGLHGIGRDVTDRRRAEREQSFLAEVGGVLASARDVEETAIRVCEIVVRLGADWCILEIRARGGARRLTRVAHADASKFAIAEALQRVLESHPDPLPVGNVTNAERATLVPVVAPGDLESVARTPRQLELLRELRPVSYMGLPLLARGPLVIGTLILFSSDPVRRYDARDLRLGEELGRRTSQTVENLQLYRAAQQAIQAREDVLKVVAHDLRNPLSTIQLSAQNITERVSDDPQWKAIRRAADAISRATGRADRLIQDLLEVVRMEAGSLTVDRRPVAAHSLVSDAAESFAPMAAAAALELSTDVPGQLPPVLADRQRVLQIFSNLLGNALKFTPAGGHIRLGAREGQGEVFFSVQDSGPGIAADQLPRLFEPFWQAQKGDQRGAGLGLPIARGIAEVHGGRLWAESKPGEGSTFYFTLPRASAALAVGP